MFQTMTDHGNKISATIRRIIQGAEEVKARMKAEERKRRADFIAETMVEAFESAAIKLTLMGMHPDGQRIIFSAVAPDLIEVKGGVIRLKADKVEVQDAEIDEAGCGEGKADKCETCESITCPLRGSN